MSEDVRELEGVWLGVSQFWGCEQGGRAVNVAE
jgi:hypothetical protein